MVQDRESHHWKGRLLLVEEKAGAVEMLVGNTMECIVGNKTEDTRLDMQESLQRERKTFHSGCDC